MPTVIIRKHPIQQKIEVDRDETVARNGQIVTFRVSGQNGFPPGTRVTVRFEKRYREVPPGEHRPSSKRGPFDFHPGKPHNPEEGAFQFDSAGDFDTDAVSDRPAQGVAHEWKYDVTWTGLPDLDPMIKIE